MSWGIALSGGAAYGMANVGILAFLHERGYQPDVIAGSSMGAIIGALYACGYTPVEIGNLAEKISMRSIVDWNQSPRRAWERGGIVRHDVEQMLFPLIGDRTIGECEIPFLCVAGRILSPIDWKRALKTGFITHVMESIELAVFPPETRILDAITASSAIPVIFSPVEIAGQQYIDLCTFGAVPARTLREHYPVDIVIGTNTAPRYENLARFLPPGMREFVNASRASLGESLAVCDLVITPELSGMPFEFRRGKAYIAGGYAAADSCGDRIEKLLQNS
jgi:NTE family protein